MSKERLERMMQYYSSMESAPLEIQEDMRWTLNYAKEQAKRVQELENENSQIRDAYQDRESDIYSYQKMLGIDFEDMAIELPIERIQGERINKLKQQNKHYREAIENIEKGYKRILTEQSTRLLTEQYTRVSNLKFIHDEIKALEDKKC